MKSEAQATAAFNAKIIGTGYACEYKALVHKKGWPEKSKRPFHLYSEDGPYLGAFATLEGLERKYRARAAC